MAYVIRRGYTGLAVKKMQHYLNVLRTSYPDLPVLKEDGSFGSATENAVMIFQKHTGLTADGIIGPATINALIAWGMRHGSGATKLDGRLDWASPTIKTFQRCLNEGTFF